MNGLNTSLRTLLGQGLQSASRGQLLRIAEALLEEDVAGVTAIPPKLSSADGRYLGVTADLVTGRIDEFPATAWKFTWDQETDLVWTDVLGDAANGETHENSWKVAQAIQVRGVPFDTPDIRQLLSIVDYDHYDPAVDPKAFRGPYGWTWTKTLCKRNDKKPAEYAWAVLLDDGGTYRGLRSGHSLVRGCCPGQLLGLR